MNEEGAIVHIVFYPHATTLDNEDGISTGSDESPISKLGKQQIKDLRNIVSKLKFDAVYCSNLERAKETAIGAFGDLNNIIIDSRLNEINIGDMTKQPDDKTAPLLSSYIDAPFPNGESFKDIENRIKSFLKDLAKKYQYKYIAIIGHQGTQLALEVLINKLSWQKAISTDWRNTKDFKYGWEYSLNT